MSLSGLLVSVAVAPVGAPRVRLPRRSVIYAVEAVRACRRVATRSLGLFEHSSDTLQSFSH